MVYNAGKLDALEQKKNRMINRRDAAEILMAKHPKKPRPTHKVQYSIVQSGTVPGVSSFFAGGLVVWRICNFF